jgi:hypothetical protein
MKSAETKRSLFLFFVCFVFYSSCHLLDPALARLIPLVTSEVRFGCKSTLASVTEERCRDTGVAVPPSIESHLGRCSIYLLAEAPEHDQGPSINTARNATLALFKDAIEN